MQTPANMENKCFCGQHFETIALLHKHITKSGHQIRCACSKLFRNTQLIVQHQIEDHKEGKSWKFHQSLKDYNTESSTTARVTCNFCQKQFTTEGLQYHKDNKHPPCRACGQRFQDSGQLEAHKRENGHYFCLEHDETFRTAGALLAHKQSEKHIMGLQCFDCDREFKTKQQLMDHKADTHTTSAQLKDQGQATAAALAKAAGKRSLRCRRCNQRCNTLEDLEYHKKGPKHNGLGDIRCPRSEKCNKIFTSPSALAQHLKHGRCKMELDMPKPHALVDTQDSTRHITDQKNAASPISTTPATGVLPSAPTIGFLGTSTPQTPRTSPTYTPDLIDFSSDDDDDSTTRNLTSASDDTTSVTDASDTFYEAQSEWSLTETDHTPLTASHEGASIDTVDKMAAWPCIIPDRIETFRKKEPPLDQLLPQNHGPQPFPRLNDLNGISHNEKNALLETPQAQITEATITHVEPLIHDNTNSTFVSEELFELPG